MKKFYQCHTEGCKDTTIYHYKGLCRGCTTYDKVGKVKTPVQRIQVNSDGSVFQKIIVEHQHRPILSKEMFLNQRRKQKVTRKQREQIEAQLKAQQAQQAQEHTCGEDCEHDHEELDFSNIGESVGEEE